MIDGHAVFIRPGESPQGVRVVGFDPSRRRKGNGLKLNGNGVLDADPVGEHIELQRADYSHDAIGARIGSKNPRHAFLGQLVKPALKVLARKWSTGRTNCMSSGAKLGRHAK